MLFASDLPVASCQPTRSISGQLRTISHASSEHRPGSCFACCGHPPSRADPSWRNRSLLSRRLISSRSIQMDAKAPDADRLDFLVVSSSFRSMFLARRWRHLESTKSTIRRNPKDEFWFEIARSWCCADSLRESEPPNEHRHNTSTVGYIGGHSGRKGAH